MELCRRYLQQGLSPSKAAAKAALEAGVKKSELYSRLLQEKEI